MIALLAVLLLCHFAIQQNCDGSTACFSPKSTQSQSISPQVKLPPEISFQADSVSQSATGPDDFASMGDSVAKLVDLFDYQHSADATLLVPEAWQTLAQHMKVAVLHLFPFVSSRYQTALADLEHHESRTRGLVIPCGTSDFHFALHLVAAVRHVFNSTLPIEVMYAGDSDLSSDQRDALESVGTDIRSVDILHFFDEETVGLLGGGWAIKPFAVLASSFEQVIIADSDVVFLQTPEAAFSHPGYISTGTLYFHDRIVPGSDDVHKWWQNIMQDRTPSPMMAKSAFWAGNTIHEQESGVVLFNKDNRSVLIGLLYAAWMNTRRIRSEATYRRTLGITPLPAADVSAKSYAQSHGFIFLHFLNLLMAVYPLFCMQSELCTFGHSLYVWYMVMMPMCLAVQVIRNHTGWPLSLLKYLISLMMYMPLPLVM